MEALLITPRGMPLVWRRHATHHITIERHGSVWCDPDAPFALAMGLEPRRSRVVLYVAFPEADPLSRRRPHNPIANDPEFLQLVRPPTIEAALAQAEQFAGKLRVPRARIRDAYAQILRCVTREWYYQKKELEERTNVLRILGKDGLSACEILRKPSTENTSEVLELATYLEVFKTDRSFPSVINNLKSDYEATRFELAMAYRFKRFWPQVELQPIVGSRRADFIVKHDGAEWICECQALRVSEHYKRVEKFLDGIMDTAKDVVEEFGWKAKVAIKMLLAPPYEFENIKVIAASLRRMLSQWLKRPWNTYRESGGFGNIELYSFCEADDINPITEGKPHDWTFIADHSRARRIQFLEKLRNPLADDYESRVFGRTFVRIEQAEIDVEEGIIERVRKKLKQLSDIADSEHRLILVESLGDPYKLEWHQIAPEMHKFISVRKRVAAIGVMFRQFHDQRWCYGGQLFTNRDSQFSVPDEVVALMAKDEFEKLY